MKRIITLITIASASLLMSFGDEVSQKAAKVEDYYKKGVQLMNAGNYDEAEKYFKAILKAVPNHKSNYQLQQLKLNRAAAKGKLAEKQVKGVIIDKIELEDAPLEDAIDALKALVDRHNGEDLGTPNIVTQDPTGKLTDKKVTLSLSNIPAEVVMTHMLDLVGARADFTEHMIKIIPR